MRVVLVVASFAALALADFNPGGDFSSSGLSPPVDSYAAPLSTSNGGPYSKGPSSEYGAPQQHSLIHKHIYVHVPPPDNDYVKPPKQYHAPPPQKHYKIVFIKAPSPPKPTVPVIPQFHQDEQKTLIYVLVKKPEDAPDLHIPEPVPTKPTKPEVYFIRYKTQKEEKQSYGPPPVASYGPPAAPPTSYGPPSGPPSGSY